MVTHDLTSAQAGDRIVRLKDGRVVADEPVRRAAVGYEA
jgi:ABC-type lipoprotein export system ATPase subunit